MQGPQGAIGVCFGEVGPLRFFDESAEVSLEAVSGRNYRNYGVAGTQVLDGCIPGQFTAAKNENPNIKTVVMTGGGNDILLGNIFCTVTWTESCNDTVRETTDAIFALRETMAEAGVEDFIYVGYGYQPSPVTKPGLDLSRQLWMEGCSETDTPRCYFVDNVVELMGGIRSDGIHPTGEGYDIIGEKVWTLMQEKGLRR